MKILNFLILRRLALSVMQENAAKPNMMLAKRWASQKRSAPTYIMVLVGVTALTALAADYDVTRWWAPGDGQLFPSIAKYNNADGIVSTISAGGEINTKDHPFFTPLGSNGRACVTCHQPADAMSLSAATAQHRWKETNGKDPLFAAVDGSNCPSLPQDQASSHSLLLNRGLIRVFRPWPGKTDEGVAVKPEFTIDVVRDPTGCNTSPQYGLKSKSPTISVYRRVRPATNLKYLTVVGYTFEPKMGMPLPVDIETGKPVSGNIMADSRASTLKSQALDAVKTHLQSQGVSPAQLKSIIDFESQIYTAQSHDRWGSRLDDAGATGGPETVRDALPGVLPGSLAKPDVVWGEYLAWKNLQAVANETSEQKAQREFRLSVARGVDVFTKRTFLVRDSSGVTNMTFGNPIRNTCAFCHNMQRMGMDIAPGQVDLGTTNQPFANPAPDLPLFKLTCNKNATPHSHLGAVVYTQDPGYALTTGRCADIGKITMQQMRGLAARAPYFSNGSAKTIREIVDFYDRRYNINYTEQEKVDLTNLMSVL